MDTKLTSIECDLLFQAVSEYDSSQRNKDGVSTLPIVRRPALEHLLRLLKRADSVTIEHS